MTDIAAADNRENGYRREEFSRSGTRQIQQGVQGQDRNGHDGEGDGP